MFRRSLHIVIMLSAACFIAAGCGRLPAPAETDADIRFSSSVLRMEARTKGVTSLDERTAFTDGNTIKVFGWHHKGGMRIFDNQTVTYDGPGDEWDYSPKQKWRWQDSDWYDFLAVPGSVTASANNEEPFSISVTYDARDSQYDLLMAGTRRTIADNDPARVVELEFKHMLCAVKVKFFKQAGGQRFVITSHRFSDLVVSANVVGYWDAEHGRFASRLANTLRLPDELFGEERLSPELVPANYVNEYDPGFYDLLLPQELDTDDGAPSLVVKFKDDVDTDPEDDVYTPHAYSPDPVPLKDITIKGTDTPITRWEAGHIYIYEIYILVNGGVLVNVVTTEWDDIHAQTPGLMI